MALKMFFFIIYIYFSVAATTAAATGIRRDKRLEEKKKTRGEQRGHFDVRSKEEERNNKITLSLFLFFSREKIRKRNKYRLTAS